MLSYKLDFNSCAITDSFRKSSHIAMLFTGAAAVINPETAPTTNCGKGIVKDTVFAEAKKAICCIVSP